MADILISWHQKSCSQTIRMTICFRWWKISWWLWLRQTGLTTIYCLLLCLWNMFWMWQASGRGEGGRGPLINFDCDWNFQFCLRPSGKMEACDSPTGLSVSSESHFFLSDRGQWGRRQVLWWLLTRDQSGSKLSKLSCCLCWQRWQRWHCYVSLTPHYRDTPRLSRTQTLRHRCLWVSLNPTRVIVRRCQIDLLQFPKILAAFRVTSSDRAILSTRGAIHCQRQKIGLTLG